MSSIYDHMLLVIKALRAHIHGATINQIVEWISKTVEKPEDAIGYTTVRCLLFGLQKIGVVECEQVKTSRPWHYVWRLRVEML